MMFGILAKYSVYLDHHSCGSLLFPLIYWLYIDVHFSQRNLANEE